MYALFDAGLVIQGRMDDFDAMAESDSWNQRYHQLGRSGFLGRSSIINSALVQLARTSYQPGIFIEGTAPAGAYTFVSQVAGDAVHCQGGRLEPNELVLLKPGEVFDFSAPKPCEIAVLSDG